MRGGQLPGSRKSATHRPLPLHRLPAIQRVGLCCLRDLATNILFLRRNGIELQWPKLLPPLRFETLQSEQGRSRNPDRHPCRCTDQSAADLRTLDQAPRALAAARARNQAIFRGCHFREMNGLKRPPTSGLSQPRGVSALGVGMGSLFGIVVLLSLRSTTGRGEWFRLFRWLIPVYEQRTQRETAHGFPRSLFEETHLPSMQQYRFCRSIRRRSPHPKAPWFSGRPASDGVLRATVLQFPGELHHQMPMRAKIPVPGTN